MTNIVRFGLVGCGGIGGTHANALALLSEAKLVAVCDVDPAKAKAMAEKFGLDRYFTTAAEMLDAVEVDAITVATDHKNHFKPALEAINRGIHVIVEKPIAASVEEAHQLVEAAKSKGVTLGGICQRRFFPAALRMNKAIVDGKIGRVTLGECVALLGRNRAYFDRDAWRGTWKGEGGGALTNQAIHMIDMTLWMMGVPTEVYGRWATLKHGEYIDVEDTSVATVSFESGALATITVTTTFDDVPTAPGFRVAVHGSAGKSVGLLESPELTQAVTDQWPFDPPETVQQWAAAEGGRPGFPAFHSDQLKDFTLAIKEGREPLVTGLDAYRAIEVIKAVYLSEKRRQPIALPMSAVDRAEADRITSGE